jgi:hypothetical protein
MDDGGFYRRETADDSRYLCPDCGYYACECEDFEEEDSGPILDGTQGGSAMTGRDC